MRAIDKLYIKRPFFGTRKVRQHFGINRKRAQRLMRLLGLEAAQPRRSTSRPAPGHKVYPYLLRNMAITRRDQVWATDITYIPLQHGFMYLTAVMDLYSRNVLSWRLSNTLTGAFCLEALDEALGRARPEIFNTDQGAQFTATAFTSRLERYGVAISMDGRGRAWTTCSSSGSGAPSNTKRSTCGTMPMAGRRRSRLKSTSTSTEPSGLTKPSATAHQWRSIREGDATNAFALNFPLRRTQYERMSIGT